jgi:hypothetical protein
MSLWGKLVATAFTIWRQATCKHGPWLKDVHSVLPKNIPSCHCKKCWKTHPQDLVPFCREESKTEWIERATKMPGGMPLELAIKTWEERPI